MKKTKLRVLSLFLVMVLFVGLLPASTLAAAVVEPQETEPTEVSAEETQPATMPEETEVSTDTTPEESSVPTDPTEPATEAVTEPVEEPAPSPSVPESTGAPVESAESSKETVPLEIPPEPSFPSEMEQILPINGATPEGYIPFSQINTVWTQGYVFRADESAPNLKYTYTLKDGTHTTNINFLYVMRLHVGGRYKVAYCIEPDTPVDSGADYGSGSNSGVSGDWMSNLTRNQQTTIGLAMLYSNIHHPDNLTSIESVEWEVATQIIIWEIVMGMRSSTAPYSCTNSSLINQFDSGRGVRYFDGSNNHYLKGMRAKYDTISSEMAIHKVVPSFTERKSDIAPTHTMKQQPNGSYSVDLTDSNGVLNRYQFSSKSPVTINQSGNTLTATAPKGASFGKLQFQASREIPNPENPACLFRIFYLGGNNQTMASPPDVSNVPYDPVPAYFKLEAEASGTATIFKTAENFDVEGYRFKIYNWDRNKSWFGKTDSNGQAYLTDKYYNEPGTKTYTFENLQDGEYTFLEVLSKKGTGHVFPDSWQIKVTNGGKTVYDKTFYPGDFTKDPNGDCRLDSIQITGLSDGGKMVMTINNASEKTGLHILKTSDDGNVAGITFTIEEWVPGLGYCRVGKYTTDTNGKIHIKKLSIGTKYRVTETVPDGYEAEKKSQEITIKDGTNTLTFVNHRLRKDLELIKTSDDGNVAGISFTVEEWQPNSDYSKVGTYTTDSSGKLTVPALTVGHKYRVTEVVPDGYEAEKQSQEITIRNGSNTLTFVNHRLRKDLELIKTSDDGNVAGISFTVEEWMPNSGYSEIGTYTTDSSGKLTVPALAVGNKYRVTESVPDGYEAEKQSQEITIQNGSNTLTFVNHPLLGSITIRKVDLQSTPLSGITFLLEYSEDSGTTWKPVVFREESSKFMPGGCTTPGLSNGSLTTGADGSVTFTGLAISTEKRHIQYRLTETATQPGYTLMTEPIFVGELPQDGNRDISFTAVNSGSFFMPHTGSDGFIAVPFGVTLLLLSASTMAFTSRKKKEEA